MENEIENNVKLTFVDTIIIVTTTIILTAIYIKWIIPSGKNYYKIIKDCGTSTPLFALIGSFLTIIKDILAMLILRPIKEKLIAKKAKDEGITEGIKQGRKQMRREMKEWRKNGRKKSECPKP